jgi:hypothetical protein
VSGYDIIGDIHGYADELNALLDQLGYRRSAGVHAHPQRKAVFVGDFIDRGPAQREVLSIVRAMVESGRALAVLGNHELNALAWATPNPDNPDEFLRPHSDKNLAQHKAFLDAFAADDEGWRDALDWFASLPLFLELDGARVVHACWDDEAVARLRPLLNADATLPPASRIEALTPQTEAFDDVETLLKGKEVALPERHSITDKDGHVRRHIRVKWWKGGGTYRDAFVGPVSAIVHIPDEPVDGDYELEYPLDDPPVFFGHYWLAGAPEPLTPNVACLDYSVARTGGCLTAYRWDGERELEAGKFVYVSTSAE